MGVLKRYWVVFASLGFIAILSLAGVAIQCALEPTKASKDEKANTEALAWDRGLYSDVPVPLTVYSSGLNKEQQDAVKLAVVKQNKDAQYTLFTYRGVLQDSPSDHIYTEVRGPTPDQRKRGGLCDTRTTILGHLGQTQRFPTFDPGTRYIVNTVCFNKIDKAKTWVQYRGYKHYSQVKQIRNRGYVFPIGHELMHSLLGHRRNEEHYLHPVNGCIFMCAIPTGPELGDVTRLILRYHVVPKSDQ